MQKIAYIIPGYGESCARQRSYKKIAKILIENGIEPVFITIDWHKHNPEDFGVYVEQFLSQYTKKRNSSVTVIGFSFGAVIGFLTAPKIKPDNLILCSLSPYFEEDLPNLKPAWVKWFTTTFVRNNFTFAPTAQKIKCRTHILVGDSEGNECRNRAKQAKKLISGSILTIIPSGKHNINQEVYQNAIKNAISSLK